MTKQCSVEEILNDGRVIIDVRSPGEYAQGHIPHAINLPLLSNDDRARVGTLYKEQGSDVAFKEALNAFAPNMVGMIDEAESLARRKQIAVYCARGGMRSQAVSWLLEMAGFDVLVLRGGYKTYRHWAIEQLEKPRQFVIIGGPSGSGKTWILRALRQAGQQALDLEKLANHRGGAYGGFGLPQQPTQEHYENKIAYALMHFEERPIWVENESRMIGKAKIPDGIFAQMERSPLFNIKRPLNERIDHLWSEYSHYNPEGVAESTKKLEKRLGSERTKKALEAIENKDMRGLIEQVLPYYDQSYAAAVAKWLGPSFDVEQNGATQSEWAATLMSLATQHGFLAPAAATALRI